MTKEQVEALPEPKAAEVLAAWVKAKRAELPSALTESNSKPHARLAKKALYQLQSAGVQLEAPKPAAAAPSTEAAPVQFEAVLSMQLGSGERAFLGAIPVRGGGIEIFQGIVHDELGLAQLGSERSNRNTWRKHMAAMREDRKTRSMIVPLSRLQLELGRALSLTRAAKTDLDTEIEQGLQRLGVKAIDSNVEIEALQPGDEAGAADAATFFTLQEFEQWLPSESSLVTLSQRVDAVNILPLDEAAKTTKKEALARELAAEAFTPAVRTLYARRLMYAAEILDANAQGDDAKRVRAEARRLAHGKAASAFAEGLFVKALPTLTKPSVAAQLGLKK